MNLYGKYPLGEKLIRKEGVNLLEATEEGDY